MADIDARISRIPETDRAEFAHKPENLGNLMNRLLINRQLANQARELGLDQDPRVQHDLQLAMEEVLATHRLNALLSLDTLPDFEQLAHERYLANPERFMQSERIIVQHILVSEEQHGEDALARAEQVLALARAPDADFVALMKEYSDDPGSAEDGTTYVIEGSGQFVPEFEEAARALEQPGQISEPVQSSFGFHLIGLVEVQEPRQRSFDDVKAELVGTVHQEYLARVREDHMRQVRSEPEHGDEELLRSLPARYGGRPE
ncbi:MAG: peptidylprolyl isomerase [Xanthomonadales bacterium]|nr:peptidylprolyl isomerase [Xanthomonadales bacterium]